jgi:hypothetical protein
VVEIGECFSEIFEQRIALEHDFTGWNSSDCVRIVRPREQTSPIAIPLGGSFF